MPNSLLELAQNAADIASRFDEAVRPLYGFDLSLPKLVKPNQIGSGVLFKLDQNYFVLTAAHCIEHYKDYQVIMACGTKLYYLSGDTYLSIKGPSGTHDDDTIDAAVFHIHGNVPDDIKACCLKSSDIDTDVLSKTRNFHVAIGYRINQSKWQGKIAESQLDRYILPEHLDHNYLKLGLRREHHVALTWEDKIIRKGKVDNTPSPKGFSGGAIVRVEGDRGKLTAITIEQRPGNQKKPPVLIGTRIGFHMGLISRMQLE